MVVKLADEELIKQIINVDCMTVKEDNDDHPYFNHINTIEGNMAFDQDNEEPFSSLEEVSYMLRVDITADLE